MYAIYQILCKPVDKSYVGMTNNPVRRKRDHFKELKEQRHYNYRLQDDFIAYGREAFEWHVIHKNIELFDDACCLERHWIERIGAYNILSGGEGFTGSKTMLGVKGGDHPASISCVWNGIEYGSRVECAEANGINPSWLSAMLNKGYSCDDDIQKAEDFNGVECTWNGINYKTISQAADNHNVTMEAMRYRLLQGWQCDEDIPRNTIACIWEGIEYESVNQAATANNIPQKKMAYWVNKGWLCQEDVISNTDGVVCVWNGITYPSIAAASVAENISKSQMRRRLDKGYTCDDDLPKRGRGVTRECVWNGINYASLTDAARSLGITKSAMSWRLSKGFSSDSEWDNYLDTKPKIS